jgi:hypothetical protein
MHESGRRGFVLGIAGLAFTATTATAQTPLTKAAGVAVLGAAAKALCLAGTSWVLVDEDGTTYPTTGLEGMTVVDVAADDRGVLAVGSRPAPPNTEATIWRSADGVAWHEVYRKAGSNSEFTGVGSGLAVGSALTGERAPKSTIAARWQQDAWSEIQVTGLTHSITTVAGDRSGWVAAAVSQGATTLYCSPDGAAWSAVNAGQLEDAAVQGVLLEPNGIRWVANAIGGSAAITGTVGAGRQPVAVREDAHAVGVVHTRRGALSYWLVDGRLVTARI